MIRLVDINKIYDVDKAETRALEHVDLNIEQGEFIGVIGTSGSGKTTLLNILGGDGAPKFRRVFLSGY